MIRHYGLAMFLSAVAICPPANVASAQDAAQPPHEVAAPFAPPADDRPGSGPLDGTVSAHYIPPEGPLPFHPRQSPAIELAQQLSAVEVYVGIRSGQIDDWRAYTTALIDFMLPFGERGAMPPDRPTKQSPRLEAFARQAIARGDKAKALLAARDTLKGNLDPAQVEKLDEAEASLRPMPFRGPPLNKAPHEQAPADRMPPPPGVPGSQ